MSRPTHTDAGLKIEAYRCTWDEGGTGALVQFFEPHELPEDDEWHAEDPPDETLALVAAVEAGEKIKALAKIGAENFSAAVEARDAADALTQQAAELCADKTAELERPRAFANDIMEAWPMGGIDGADLQDIAEKHGMLLPVTMTAPCHEECNCTDYGLTPDEWARGHVCYRKTALLKGPTNAALREQPDQPQR
jgi:hypothetical protein